MNRFRFFEHVRWYSLGLGLSAALALLAALQYRSNRQLRDVLQKQMRATLQGSLMNVRFGLEQEFSPIGNTLRPPPNLSPNPHGDNWDTYVREFAQWRNTAVHPALVANIFVYQREGQLQSELFQLRLDSNKFGPVDWPADFIRLRERLDQVSASDPGPSSWMIEENIPALVHSIRSFGKPAIQPPGIQAFVVVQLNLPELAHHIVPELAQRYLGSNGHLDYQVALISGNADRSVVYSSDPGFGVHNDRTFDAQLNVFGPPMSSGNGGLASGLFPSTAGSWPRPAGVGEAPELNQPGPNQFRPNHFGSPGAPSTIRPAEPPLLRREPGPLMLQTIRYSPADRGWTIVARHRKGSLEAAVATVYHRNLAVSFGVLLVLAGTIAMVVMTTQRARRLAELQMDFVGRVSHELRTPLTGIVSAAQNVADGLVDNKERAMRYGSAILGQAQQLSELIEQILLFSATEKGRYQYYFQWVDVPEVIAAGVASSASLVRSSGVRIEQSIEPNLPQIWADFKALTQCLQNLIVNSIKYGGESRWVGIRAHLAQNSAASQEVVITIEDRGLGIKADDLKKIFDPFYRSPIVAAAQIHGSGLGLSIVKSFAEAMGGKLTVQSEVGKGSSFSVHLPADKKPVLEDTSESAQFDAAR